jgi:hypothetical protein
MKEPLALSNAEWDSILFFEMMGKQWTIPEVLVIAQLSWRAS